MPASDAERAYAEASGRQPSQPGQCGRRSRPLPTAAATAAHTNAVPTWKRLDNVLDGALEANGIEMDGDNVMIANVAPDEGLSAPFNSWFTLFGQFFDHGLDLVTKGGSGTVFIPLHARRSALCPGKPRPTSWC